jgi:hypothetical protein
MNRRSSLAVLLLTLSVLPLAAQTNPQCAGYQLDRARNVCDAAIDGAHLFTPVAGILVSGGNAVLGSSDGLGGAPHFTITLRANATRVVVPDVNYSGTGRTVAADQTVTAPAPIVEGALGVYRGTSHGLFALDLLGSAQLLPTKVINSVTVAADARRIGSIALGLGIGGRLTLLGEGAMRPGITVSVMRRSIPRLDVGKVADGDRFSFGTDLTVTNYRATIGKQFSVLALAAGAGWDQYTGRASVTFRDPLTDLVQPPIAIGLSDKRAVAFANAGLVLGPVLLVGELGYQRGKNLGLGTTFTNNDPTVQRLFGGAGIRFGF